MTDPTPIVVGTYDPSESTVIHRMRGAISDIDVDSFYIPDETYAARLVQYTDWRLAAASIADTIATLMVQDPTSLGLPGGLSIGWTGPAAEFSKRAKSLRDQYAAETAGEMAGGMRVRQMRRADRARRGGEYRPDARFRRGDQYDGG